MHFTIAEAMHKDLPDIQSIINYEILNSTAVYDYEPKTLREIENWFSRKKAEEMPVIVAKHKDAVVGYGTFGIFRPEYYRI